MGRVRPAINTIFAFPCSFHIDSSVGFHDVAFISSDDKWKIGHLRTSRATDPFYDECGQTKTCLGAPNGCLSTRDCVAVATVRAKGTKYLFEMRAKNAAYVAVGISNDKRMVTTFQYVP